MICVKVPIWQRVAWSSRLLELDAAVMLRHAMRPCDAAHNVI